MVKRGLEVISLLFFLSVVGYLACYIEVKGIELPDLSGLLPQAVVEEEALVADEIIAEATDEEEFIIEVPDEEVPTAEVETLEVVSNVSSSGYIIETPYDEKIVCENGLEMHYIAGDTFRGIMTIVSDPSRVFVGAAHEKYDSRPGESATAIAKKYDALYAVNGAFFVDTDQKGNGGTPIGFVFSEGKLMAGGTGTSFVLMGLDNNNNFIIDAMTGAQAQAIGIRDAVTCKPILVKDGQVTNLAGASTTLIDARTCIGATAEGYILFLTIDGRMSHSFGATTRDCADVMLAFGAVNAGNLDGGGSVCLYYAGENPIDAGVSTLRGSRPSPEAFCIRK